MHGGEAWTQEVAMAICCVFYWDTSYDSRVMKFSRDANYVKWDPAFKGCIRRDL